MEINSKLKSTVIAKLLIKSILYLVNWLKKWKKKVIKLDYIIKKIKKRN